MNSSQFRVQDLEVLQEYHKRSAIKSLHHTLRLFWDVIIKDKFYDNWHLHYLCSELEKLSEYIIQRKPKPYDLIINIPPGSTKSTVITIMWDVWLWIKDPTIITINSSYSSGLSVDHSTKFRDIIKSERFNDIFQSYYVDTFDEELYLIKDTETNLVNNFGGARIATSTGGTITGRHGHLIKRDDPMNPEDAESEAKRLSTHRFNDRTLASRRKDKEATPTVTVMQRLHDEDTTGHELEKSKKKIRHLSLPAEINDKVRPQPEELAQYYKDGLLDPVRLNRTILEEFAADLGSYGYSGQMLQFPYPEEGGLIKKDWFVIRDEIPTGFPWDLWIDGAYTENKSNDPTGFMVCGFWFEQNILIVRDFRSEWMTIPDLLEAIPNILKDNNGSQASMIRIEPKASGHDLINMIKRESVLNVSKIKGKLVQQGKTARVNYASPKVQSSRIHLIRGNWNNEFITQLTAFPNYKHDEACDLLGYAVKKYFG